MVGFNVLQEVALIKVAVQSQLIKQCARGKHWEYRNDSKLPRVSITENKTKKKTKKEISAVLGPRSVTGKQLQGEEPRTKAGP